MPDQNGIELRWIFKVLLRWWWLILGCGFLAGLAAFAVASWLPPTYESSVTLLVEPAKESNATEYTTLITGERLALTYGEMLKSRPVMDAAIALTGIPEDPDVLATKVSATPIRDTQLIRLTVQADSAKKSALYANAVARAFIDHIKKLQAERYTEAISEKQNTINLMSDLVDETQVQITNINTQKIETETEIDFLKNQLNSYRDDYRELQQSVQQIELAKTEAAENVKILQAAQVSQIPGDSLSRANITFLINQSASNSGDNYSSMLASERLALTYAEMVGDISILEAALNDLGITDSPESYVQKITVSAVPNTQLIRLSVTDINPERAGGLANAIAENFLTHLNRLLSEPYEEKEANLQNQMDEVISSIDEIQSEVNRKSAMLVQYQTALADNESLLNNYRTDLRSSQQEYEALRLDAAQTADAVVIAEPALEPTDPTLQRFTYTILAGIVGLVVGIGIAFLIEYMDNKIRSADDIYTIFRKRPIGTIRHTQHDSNPLVIQPPHPYEIAEEFRQLSTNLRLSLQDQSIKSIIVSSAEPGEGKSFVCSNLAITAAKAGQRVAIMDADMRLPSIHSIFNLDNNQGLYEALQKEKPDYYLHSTSQNNVQILTSGNARDNSPELIHSPMLPAIINDLSQSVDLLLIDSPPLLTVADARILARMVDGVLLVIRAGKTERQEAQEVAAIINQIDAKLIGIVLNDIENRSIKRYQYYASQEEKIEKSKSWYSRLAEKITLTLKKPTKTSQKKSDENLATSDISSD